MQRGGQGKQHDDTESRGSVHGVILAYRISSSLADIGKKVNHEAGMTGAPGRYFYLTAGRSGLYLTYALLVRMISCFDENR